jgi:tetratricopeptide (TPR) repeat protein
MKRKGENGPPLQAFYALRGFAWASTHNVEQARRALGEALRLAPSDPEISYWVGRSYLILGEYSEAIEKLEPLVKRMGDDAGAGPMIVLAEALHRVGGREAEAEVYVDAAIRLDPSRAKAHRLKGFLLAAKADSADSSQKRELLEGARSYLANAIRLGDDSAGTHLVLGGVYRDLDDGIDAVKNLERSCELDSAGPGCWWTAETYAATGKVDSARAIFQRLHQVAPNDSELWLNEGILWYKTGHPAEAANAYQEVLRRDSGSMSAHGNLGFVLFDLEDYAAALKHFEQALAIHSDEADLLAGKGIVLAKLGRPDEASQSFGLAVSRDPSYLNCEVLKKRNLWSEKACQTARALIARVRQK